MIRAASGWLRTGEFALFFAVVLAIWFDNGDVTLTVGGVVAAALFVALWLFSTISKKPVASFWFAVALLAVIVEGTFVVEHARPPVDETGGRPASVQAPEPQSVSPLPAKTAPQTPREFVELNFEALTARTKGLNGIEAVRVYAVYVGKWIRVSGQIDDVIPAGNTGPIVARLQAPTTNAGTVYMTFDRTKWADRLGAMSRGDTLTASCRIELVQQNGMSLSDCEVQ